MAKTVSVTLRHDLGRDQAKERIRNGFDQMGAAIGSAAQVEQDWTGDAMAFRAKVMGQSISGRLDVRDTDVLIEMTLPGLLGALADKVAGALKQQGTLLLTKK